MFWLVWLVVERGLGFEVFIGLGECWVERKVGVFVKISAILDNFGKERGVWYGLSVEGLEGLRILLRGIGWFEMLEVFVLGG